MFSIKTWSVFRLSYGPHHRACSVVSEFLFSLIFFSEHGFNRAKNWVTFTSKIVHLKTE